MMSFIKGFLSLTLYIINMVVHAFLVLFSALLYFLMPLTSWKNCLQQQLLEKLPMSFHRWNGIISEIATHGRWDVLGIGALKKDGWYLLLSNHRTWIDILVLGKIFNGKIPPLKFFMKKELLWQLPLAGLACYALGYPFMSRHSAAQIKKNPKLKGKDVAATKKACEKIRAFPSTLINFSEGTRFTPKKKNRQDSPFEHLLKPRAGGAAVVLHELGDKLTGVINVVITYAPAVPGFWAFCCGNFGKIVVRYEVIPITPEMIGDYENDREFRASLQQWFNTQWQKNDALIERQLRENV